MYKLLIINPGSTSTKIAFFKDSYRFWQEDIAHDEAIIKSFHTIYDQLQFRLDAVLETFAAHGNTFEEIDCVVSRGGLLPPVPAGAFEVNEAMIDTLRYRPVNHHASNLGAAIAYKIAQPLGIKAYIYDPVTVDEMIDIVRITGKKEIRRFGQGHNLNMRAAAMKYAEQINRDYADLCVIVAHLGGGITLSLQDHGRIIDMISDDEGAFSPERAGALPSYLLLRYVDEHKLGYNDAMKKLQREGGLKSLLNTTDARRVEEMISEGDEEAELVYRAMALSVARSIAKLSVVCCGKIDQIVLTGGIAYSKMFTEEISGRVSFIAPVTVIPGENEMQALADGAIRVLKGKEIPHIYKV